MMPYTDYTVRLGDLKKAIMENPYDPTLNIDGYMRYLKYNTPSAQPEIIRCKECRWGKEVCGNIECFVDDDILTEYHGYEWFCPKGERRTDE